MRSTTKLIIVAAMLAFVANSAFAAPSYPPAVTQWLKAAQVGPYQEAKVDYNSLYQAAKKEGKLVVYSGSSRMPAVALEFEKLYPGIKVEVEVMGTAEAIEKFEREAVSGLNRVDVFQASQAGRQKALLYDRNYLFTWVPPDLKSVLTQDQMEPFLHWRYGSRQWAYNDSVNKAEPFESLWELTEPKWKKRVVIGDPRLDGGTLDYFIMIVLKANELATEYQRYYGKPIKLTTPNAGYEWIKRLLQNDPILVKGEKDIPPIIGEKGLKDAPVGLVAGSRFAWVDDPTRGNLRFFPTLKTKPSVGVMSIYPVGIAYKSPHPNAAKLFIRYLFGDEKGGGGWTEFHVPGNWPARSDIVNPPSNPTAPDLFRALWPVSKINIWFMDEEAVYLIQADVLDFLTDMLF